MIGGGCKEGWATKAFPRASVQRCSIQWPKPGLFWQSLKIRTQKPSETVKHLLPVHHFKEHLITSIFSPHFFPQVGKIRKTAARKREYHILFMVVTTAVCYLVCWMPYGVVAMMATFGPPNMISPVASVVPSLLAKSSTVINPLIYILMNKQVSESVELQKCEYYHRKQRKMKLWGIRSRPQWQKLLWNPA